MSIEATNPSRLRAGETAEEKVDRDLANENRDLRRKVTELEWELENFRQAWKMLASLAEKPRLEG